MIKTKKTFLLFVISLILITFVPFVLANTPADSSGESAVGKEISITIYWPKEGGIAYNDVVGIPYTVQGEVEAINGIKNVTISDGTFVVNCDDKKQQDPSHFNMMCDVPRNYNDRTNKYRYVISVFDKQGYVKTVTLNFSYGGGFPPQNSITHFSAHGKVTDNDGNPLSNALLVFEFPEVRVWGPNGFRSFTRNVNSMDNGTYTTEFIEDGRASAHQNVNITKEGYYTFKEELDMKADSNEINFVLTPLHTPTRQKSPGFDSTIGVYSLVLGLLFFSIKRR